MAQAVDPSGTLPSAATLTAESVIHPWENAAAILRHGHRARSAGDLGRAHTFYSRAVELDPKDPRGWAGLAATTADPDQALLQWAHVLTLAPNDMEACSRLDDGIANKLERDGHESAESFLQLGRQLAQMGLRHWAYRLLVRATEFFPQREEAWLWRAGTADTSTETALCLKRVLDINPQNSQALAGMAWASTVKKPVSAPTTTNLTDEAARQSMDQGRQAWQAGNQTLAYESFKRATELNPQYTSAWFWRGSTTVDLDEALLCMDQVLLLSPQDAAALDARWYLRLRKWRATPLRKPRVRRPGFEETAEPLSPDEEIEEEDEATESKPNRALVILWIVAGAMVVLVAVLLIGWFVLA